MTLTCNRPLAVTIQVADYPLVYGNSEGCCLALSSEVWHLVMVIHKKIAGRFIGHGDEMPNAKRPLAVTIHIAENPLLYGNREGCRLRSAL